MGLGTMVGAIAIAANTRQIAGDTREIAGYLATMAVRAEQGMYFEHGPDMILLCDEITCFHRRQRYPHSQTFSSLAEAVVALRGLESPRVTVKSNVYTAEAVVLDVPGLILDCEPGTVFRANRLPAGSSMFVVRAPFELRGAKVELNVPGANACFDLRELDGGLLPVLPPNVEVQMLSGHFELWRSMGPTPRVFFAHPAQRLPDVGRLRGKVKILSASEWVQLRGGPCAWQFPCIDLASRLAVTVTTGREVPLGHFHRGG